LALLLQKEFSISLERLRMKQRGAPLLCAAAILTIITQIAAHADRPGFKGDCRDVSHYPSHLSPEAKHNRLLRDEVSDILSEYLEEVEASLETKKALEAAEAKLAFLKGVRQERGGWAAETGNKVLAESRALDLDAQSQFC